MGIYTAMDAGMMDAFNEQEGNPSPSEDPTETAEFRTWFGSSKVVDADGTPLPVFHGSESEFNQFDYNFIGSGNDQEGPGFYFTSAADDANRYTGKESGKVYEVYLRIENPVPMEGEIDGEEIRKMVLVSTGFSDEEELWSLEGNDAYWEMPLSNWDEHPVSAFENLVNSIITYNESPHAAFQSVWADAFGFDSKAYLEAMVKLGYDGVIVKRESMDPGDAHYVLFDPSGVKAVVSKGFSGDHDIYKNEITPKIDEGLPGEI